jgi:hypothetical protein
VTEESLRHFKKSRKVLPKYCAKYITQSKREKTKAQKENASLGALVQAIQVRKKKLYDTAFLNDLCRRKSNNVKTVFFLTL